MLQREPEIGLTDFRPNTSRAADLDARVRGGVAESIGALIEVLDQHGVSSTSDRTVLERLHAGPVSPSIVAMYADLVEAVLAERVDEARTILEEMVVQRGRPAGGLRIATLRDTDLGEGQSRRYQRRISDDPAAPLAIAALDESEFRAAAARVGEALELLGVAVPELAGEIRALVRELVLVRNGQTRGSSGFGGASSFYLWGALFLNAMTHLNRIDIIEGLAHESAHMLLFGLGLGSPLVQNPREERFASPLRSDPRPMEGIVHATYVLARMHYAASRLLESNLLTPEERATVSAARERHRAGYLAGLSVVDAHARWTPMGEAAFDGARHYMAEAASN
jgi:hypothetical protein